jgi:D-3-phosphoglycerate dehydrogenase
MVSDFISQHVPLNAETKGLFGPQALATVRRGVVLLNFAREGVVEAKELRAALDEGLIGRYVCDFPAVELLGHPRVIALPHLGASTVEAEENCGVMVVDQVRDFLEHGHISNSVNFPSLHLPRSGRQRVCIANRNVPNMIGQLSHAFGAAGLNIAQMQNASRGDLAYTVIDLDGQAGPAVIGELEAIAGVLAVRVL